MQRYLVNIHLEMKARYPIWWKAGWFCIWLFVLFFFVSLVDNRQVNSINTWYKPMKFCLSVGIYLLTIIWVIDLLNIAQRKKEKIIKILSIIIIFELFLIVFQGARGVISHYNITSIFNVVVFQLMGIAIALNTFILIWITFQYCKKKSRPTHISRHMTNFILIGLLLLLFSSAIGGKMIGLNNHLVLPDTVSNFYIPLLDWKPSAGDLRISHFLGIHGIQLFAILGIYINSSPSLSRSKLIGFYTLIIGYYLLVLCVFLISIR